MPETLPNFRNLGVMLRIVLLVNGLVLIGLLSHANSFQDLGARVLQSAAYVQPVMLSSLLALYALSILLLRLNYAQGVAAVLAVVALIAWAIAKLGGELFSTSIGSETFNLWRKVGVSVGLAAVALMYFRLRTRLLSPAIPGARLQALQARIRPHFLFNSINAVLGIVRSDPKRAESALEDMSDLFRMAMTDSREMVTLKQELELSRQYLALEQLRLGERLKINWQIQDMPEDALVPPLMLQPLLENAVYHGIEPMYEGGEIVIKIYRSGKEMHLDVHNPYQPDSQKHSGNKMALENIRERLALQFDLEASYTVDAGKDYYRVHILIPYVKEEFQ
ncbi:MAG: histidine kinase [Gallionellaceae bacterium]|nr:histidine kinase [Gallionellaceae bacterium]